MENPCFPVFNIIKRTAPFCSPFLIRAVFCRKEWKPVLKKPEKYMYNKDLIKRGISLSITKFQLRICVLDHLFNAESINNRENSKSDSSH